MNLRDLQPAREEGGWQAKLELGYTCEDGVTRLTRRRHVGPLVVQKPFYPEGRELCHSVLLHPPGGVAGGDRLEVEIAVSAGAHALITTPGAAKWYRSAGPLAEQRITLASGAGGSLEWLPQENIVFDRAQARMSTLVQLDEGACYIGWDITRLGRTASGERFDAGELRSRTEVLRAGRRLWGDYARIEGGAALLRSPAGLVGRPVMGIFLAADSAIERQLLDAARAVAPPDDAQFGVTALPGVLVARYLGDSAAAARAYFISLWRLTRAALLRRDVSLPRIWNT
jgi:urease accessory protein